MNNLDFIERMREQIPEEEEQKNALEQLREFSQWLLIVPIVIILLFGCGSLGLFTTSKVAYADTSSSLDAEYGPWPFLAVRAVRPEIIEEIQLDQEDDPDADQIFRDPLAYNSEWLEGEPSSAIVVALAPTEPILTDTSEPAGSTAPPESTEASTSTTAPQLQTTLPPSATDPSPTNPSPTNPGASNTAPPSATAVPSSSPTSPSTATSVPTDVPTSTTAPVNYCVNINYISKRLENWQDSDTVWKFVFYFANNNTIPMYLTNYKISWSPSSDLHLNRTKTIRFPGSNRPKLVSSTFSSPGSCPSCSGTTIEYPAQAGQAEIYNMFCNDWSCDENNAIGIIPQANYSFTANATFTFYGPSGTVSCPKTWTASGMAN